MVKNQTGSAPSQRGPLAGSPGSKREQTASPANSKEGQIPSPSLPRPSRDLIVVLCLALGVLTLAIYAETYRSGFIAYDDDQYVYDNAIVKEGLTLSGARWALTTFHAANWHPVTWLSHMLDCELFGLNAGAHHLVNVAFHLANVGLLFIAFVLMTRRPWESAFVAGIFALHPLHVESVAWISERKDVLSTFFGLLTILFYIRYVQNLNVRMTVHPLRADSVVWSSQRKDVLSTFLEVLTILFYIPYVQNPNVRRYVPVALCFALALMAKPMLVTLPFVLLLLDIWPLGRFPWPPTWRTLTRLLLEKAPLLAMVAAASAVTFVSQQRFGAVASLSRMDFSARLANASIGYLGYIAKGFWPAGLAVLYPIKPPVTQDAIAAFLVLLAATIAALAFAKRRPYLLVGWFWYLGMLVPVIGIVQVGSQSMADRYTYLPLVGLSVAVVWLVADLVGSRRPLKRAAAAIAFVALVLLAAEAHRQAALWQSSRSLFEHTLAVTDKNYIIHNNLGVALAQDGEFADSVSHYQKALAIYPDYAEAHANLGHELLALGRFDEAYNHLTEAVRILPTSAAVHTDLGTLLAAQGKLEEAKEHLEESLRIKPDQATVHSNLGFVLQRLGRLDEAIAHCAKAMMLDPKSVDAHYNMGMALAAQGKNAEGAAEFSRVLVLNPDHAAARAALNQLQPGAAP